MENKELLYELEYKVNELRRQYLSEVEYNELTIKEVLDLGFNNTNIIINEETYNLGYKWKMIDLKTNEEKIGYETADFGVLTNKQLSCKVKYCYTELVDVGYTDLYVELVNEEDEKLFKVIEE